MTTLSQALSVHTASLAAGGQTAATVRKARYSIQPFTRRHGLSGITLVFEVTREHIEGFLADGRERRKWCSRTERRHFYDLFQFFRTCVNRGFLSTSPMEGMEPPSYLDRPPQYETYTDEDIEAILNACDDAGGRWMRLRNRAIIWLMWTGGLRRREILALKVADIDFAHHAVRLSNRGTVALEAKAVAAIECYLAERNSDSPHLFLRRGKKPILETTFEHTLHDISKLMGRHINAQSLCANWKARGGPTRRPLRNPYALMNREWPDCPMARARDSFLASVAAQGLSRSTEHSYKESTAQFLAHILERRPSVSPDEITRADIEGFLASLHARKLSLYTVHRCYRGLRRWFGILHDREEIPRNPVDKVNPPRLPKITIAPYHHKDVERLLAAATQSPKYAERDAAMITALYGTGVRRMELMNLAPSDILPGQLVIRQGKGMKDRHVPLDSHTEGVLRRYAENSNGSTRLFAPLGINGVYQRIRRLGKRASVDVSRAIHRFRDTFAVRYLENGGAIDDLQVILGHSSMETTLRYVRWGREQRAVDAGRRFTPWANNGHNGEDALSPTDELTLLNELEQITRRKLELVRDGHA